jgi:hypothetical protein
MSIPFEVPPHLAAQLAPGVLKRSGALLRETSSGRIVAHLQETTGLLQTAAGLLGPVKVAQLAAQGVQIYQNEQIKAGLALVQQLGIANLALTGVGIGVNIAGFAILSAKLSRIERELGGLAAAVERLGRKVDGIRGHLVRQELADLRAELRRIDDAWSRESLDEQSQQWRLASDRLLSLEERFHGHARALSSAAEEPHLRDVMIDAFIMAANARRVALLAAGEELAAENAAREMSTALNALTANLGSAELLAEALAAERPSGLAARAEATTRLMPRVLARAHVLRDREEMAASAPLTIAALRGQGVSGRSWLEQARLRTEAPLICLSVPVSDPAPA